MTASWPSRLLRRARYLLRRASAEREMHDEMRLHLEMEIEDRMRRGMTPDEARRTALVDFGGVENHKEDARTARGVRPVEDLAQDAGYALRVLRRSPGFTVASVLIVAIGVAATTVVFSAADALLLRPLPVREPGRLVVLSELWKDGQRSTSTSMGLYEYSYRHYLSLRRATADVFEGLAGFRYAQSSLRVGDDARALGTIATSANYFQVLGLRPALGRLYSDTAERFGAPPEAVISWDFWQSDLAGDSSIVGKTLWVNSRPMPIVGVAPRGFAGTTAGIVADLWVPAAVDARPPDDTKPGADPLRALGRVTMIGRLAPRISATQAERALEAIAPNVESDDPSHPVRSVSLDPMTGIPKMARGPVAGFTAILLGMAALVLLIAVANVAGMLLARGARRRREIAVRLALGASSGRLVRQLVTESVLLCLTGGTVGVLLARWAVTLVPILQPPIGVRTHLDLRLDALVLAVSFGVTLVAGVATGLTPALEATRFDLQSGLRGGPASGGGAGGAGARARRSRARVGFVIAQLAMSLVLLVTAGLFVRALERATRIDPGLDATNVAVAEVSVESHRYGKARGVEFYRTLMERLRARPEVEAASLGEWIPLSLKHNGVGIDAPDGGRVPVTYGVVDGDYFATVRIPLVQGRAFDDASTTSAGQGAALVAIVNETLARRMWPGRSPIGQTLRLDGERQVIGVARDGKYRGLDERATAYAFLPFGQPYNARMTIHARGRRDAGQALAAIRQEVARLDPNIALEQAGVLAEQLGIYYLPQRAAAWFVGAFGLVGLALAAIGIYGVIAYGVARRTRELGIRLALGADRKAVVALVLKEGLVLVGWGLLVGVIGALGVGRLAAGFLYGVRAGDPVTFVVVPVMLGAVALAASWIPARRAARVDPMVSLRAD